ncbi:Peptidoglycan O-acetyltransferase [Planctomycetes bacterium Poly30]|uniref:Peptidoglycan O-acetyltransferase n=1 Tax=Saltatorellus ferox TaxID=2528018 RepID=A0A518EXE2_9BACT|nr:Peptidoglycan O-acetyltransferase [Planctomycetes bacterium Poly30]
MVFSQPTFLFAFLPLVLGLHLLAPRWARNGFLLLASLLFYAWGEGGLVGLLMGSAVLNYLVGRRIVRAGEESAGGSRRRWTAFGIGANLGLLVLFKYAGWLTGGALAFDLPLGISFFTFQAISFLVDIERRDAEPPRSLGDFALYLALFPQLVAGPIVRYRDLAAQIRERAVTSEAFGEGVRRFVFGLAKKVLIADTLAGPADAVFALGPEALGPAIAWLGVAAYTLQIYFDFSGYSDMAIGIGLMLGFRLPENFLHPYASRSITEFWRRWHISLSSWFRDYLYIPLGGSRRGPARTYLNLWIVFLFCGLWHGAAWTFVLWGAYHGLLLVVERLGAGAALRRAPGGLAVAVTVLLVAGGWVLFRAADVTAALDLYAALAGRAGALAQPLALHANAHVWTAMAAGALLSLPVYPALESRLVARGIHPAARAAGAVATLALLVLTIVGISGQTHSPFLYFRF